MNLLGHVVKATYSNGVTIEGTVIDSNDNGFIMIENSEDCFTIDLEKVTIEEVIVNEKMEESNFDKLEAFMEKYNFDFIDSGVMEDNGSIDYINGFTYEVMVFIPNNGSGEDFYLETIHKGKKKDSDNSDDYTANRHTRKTWKSFERLLMKYLEA